YLSLRSKVVRHCVGTSIATSGPQAGLKMHPILDQAFLPKDIDDSSRSAKASVESHEEIGKSVALAPPAPKLDFWGRLRLKAGY
ncbi:MAG TPA: hypothetical protein VMF61_00220, partial [Candidatus Acidoferrales bacterium]|nr:hypothetical protein [Candidatus Acidoferrales bacterium]